VNASGTVVERYAYDANGAFIVMDDSWTLRSGSLYAWQYLFQGRPFDSDAGLYDDRARAFSPTLGRWLQMDPTGFSSADINLYGFELNRSTSLLDPDGTDVIPITIPGGWWGNRYIEYLNLDPDNHGHRPRRAKIEAILKGVGECLANAAGALIGLISQMKEGAKVDEKFRDLLERWFGKDLTLDYLTSIQKSLTQIEKAFSANEKTCLQIDVSWEYDPKNMAYGDIKNKRPWIQLTPSFFNKKLYSDDDRRWVLLHEMVHATIGSIDIGYIDWPLMRDIIAGKRPAITYYDPNKPATKPPIVLKPDQLLVNPDTIAGFVMEYTKFNPSTGRCDIR
jgi:RHS repeat-associated protein